MRLAALLLSLLVTAPAAWALTPMKAVQAFCRADGRGDRVLPRTWVNIAPLVQWGLEPAWDHVVLIAGYEVSEARYRDGEHAEVTVTYYVAADVEGGSITREPREEKRVFHLIVEETRAEWFIAGPPPPPHVFLSQADPDEMAASLDADTGSFLSSSAFVRGFLSGAGWDLSPFAASKVPTLPELGEVTHPAAGDLVLYFDGETAYHLGVLEAEDIVVSATLNGGVRRAPLDAFAGKVRFWRPRASARALTPAPQKRPVPRPAPAKPARKAGRKR